jgi:hypothetical protein
MTGKQLALSLLALPEHDQNLPVAFEIDHIEGVQITEITNIQKRETNDWDVSDLQDQLSPEVIQLR